MLSERDQHDLRWLEIGHYAAAAYMLVMGVGMWIFMRMLAPVFDGARNDPAREVFNVFFAAMTVGWCLAGLAASLGSALLIRRRKYPTALVILSAIHCVFMPLGTAAGIFAIILVRRPSIHAAFTGAHYTPPPEPPEPDTPFELNQADQSELKTLTTLYRVVGVITGVFSLFPLIHVLMGIAMWFQPTPETADAAAVRAMGGLFAVLGLAFIAIGGALAVATWRAAGFVEHRGRWTYCVIVAAIQCTFFPFGTALGIYALVVLNRERIRRTFEAAG